MMWCNPNGCTNLLKNAYTPNPNTLPASFPAPAIAAPISNNPN